MAAPDLDRPRYRRAGRRRSRMMAAADPVDDPGERDRSPQSDDKRQNHGSSAG